ncbi:MAG: metallophosphatase family protein [Candidatus Edwardsbacteria bacterium]|jgi:diadenosine tetraphosphatase ApaH/serine/threonine PP2A family protein phosphatase|nr:metallophosphatase family protein [Candidatus Edwardsbacteria bacterium]
MTYAIISDIHGNYDALSAVLGDIMRSRVDRVVCLGDIVGYGAEPGKCIAAVQGLDGWTVAGNHDHGAIGQLDPSYFNANARRACEWTAAVLSAADRRYLAALPLQRRIEDGDRRCIAVHSTPLRPEDWHYILSIDEAEYQFEQFGEPVCLVGHSHQPVFWQLSPAGECSIVGREYLRLEPGRRYIINAGSVGQPRDGDPRACYALCDGDRRELVIRRVEYDIGAAQKKILKAGLPPRLAERLAHGT